MQTRRQPATPPEPPTCSYDRGQLQRLLQREPPKRVRWNTETVAIAIVPSLAAPPKTERSASLPGGPTDRHPWHLSRSWLRRALAFGVPTLLALGAIGLLHPHPTRPSSQASSAAQPAPTSSSAPARATSPSSNAALPRLGSNGVATDAARSAAAPLTAPSVEAAVAALASGQDQEALATYQALSRVQPEKPVFAAIAAILQHRLAARCKARLESGATPCATDAE